MTNKTFDLEERAQACLIELRASIPGALYDLAVKAVMQALVDLEARLAEQERETKGLKGALEIGSDTNVKLGALAHRLASQLAAARMALEQVTLTGHFGIAQGIAAKTLTELVSGITEQNRHGEITHSDKEHAEIKRLNGIIESREQLRAYGIDADWAARETAIKFMKQADDAKAQVKNMRLGLLDLRKNLAASNRAAWATVDALLAELTPSDTEPKPASEEVARELDDIGAIVCRMGYTNLWQRLKKVSATLLTELTPSDKEPAP